MSMSFAWEFTCLSLELSIQLFLFPFLFSWYCCSVYPCVDCAVSDCCNQSFFALFYVVFDLSYRCIDAISSVLFWTHVVRIRNVLIVSMGHFSMPNSIPIASLYILIAGVRMSNLFYLSANSSLSFMYIMWLIISCDLVSFCPLIHFLNMWLRDIIPITKINDNIASLGIYLCRFSPQRNVFLLLSIPLSSFSWFPRWILWLC